MEDELAHEYDPVKRREYYLRTRELKGRAKAAVKTAKGPRKAAVKKPSIKSLAQKRAERQRKLEAELAQLKNKLARLRDELQTRVQKAQLRGGKKPKTFSRKSTEKTFSRHPAEKATHQRHQTATQKAKARERSKDYYEKNRDKILADEVKSLKAKIKTIQERLAKMRTTNK